MIGELPLEDLTPGALAALFEAGKAAVLVRCPDVVAELWRHLLENKDEQLPWEAPLVDIARNYHGCGDITASLGDLFYFQFGQHGYIARKIALTRDGDEGRIVADPPYFVQGSERFSSEQSVLNLCWSVGNRLMAAMSPGGIPPPDYEVTIQRLKYQETTQDFEHLAALVRNSLGRWGRLGCRLDERRIEAAGPLRPKGISDFYGILAHVPLVRPIVRAINAMLARRDSRMTSLPPGQRLIEGAHYDYRYFSALCGKRRDTVTQIFVKGVWHDLPVDLNTLAIFPGSMSTRKFGMPHVLHRVLHVPGADGDQDDGDADARTQNVTLLIGSA